MDMERLKMQGIKLSNEWSVNDRLDDMMFEVKRHMIHLDEMNNIILEIAQYTKEQLHFEYDCFTWDSLQKIVKHTNLIQITCNLYCFAMQSAFQMFF